MELVKGLTDQILCDNLSLCGSVQYLFEKAWYFLYCHLNKVSLTQENWQEMIIWIICIL